MKEKLLIVLLILFSFFVVRSLIMPGFVPTHDGEYHIIRLWQFDKNIQKGNLFPIWAPDINNGYGIPIFEFFYPLPNYIGEVFHILGFSFTDSIKMVLASGLIFSGIFFYFWLRCFFNAKFSLLGSIMYILAPYHLVDVFIRGSVGEVWSLTITPLSLFFITKNVENDYKNTIFRILTPVSLSLLLLSHNILGVVFFVFSFFYCFVITYYSKKRIKLIFLADYIFAVLLSSFFWLPILLEEKFISGLKIINYKDHFPALFQLIFPSWGSGFSVPGISDQMSFQIGIPHLIVVSLIFLYFLVKKKKDFLLFFLLMVFIFTFFLMTETSNFIWQTLSFLSYFQYPWRLLSVIILTSSFLVGYFSKFKWEKTIFIILLGLVILSYFPYTNTVVYEKRSDDFYLQNNTWSKGGATLGNTFNTIWFTGKSPYQHKMEVIDGEAEIVDQQLELTKYTLEVNATTLAKIRVNTVFYPGWVVKINGKPAKIDHSDGLMSFFVPRGKNSIIVKLEDSFSRLLGKMISLFALLALFILNIKSRKI